MYVCRMHTFELNRVASWHTICVARPDDTLQFNMINFQVLVIRVIIPHFH